MKKYKSGFVFGKFMPLHIGHQFLIEEAYKQCDHLTILVCAIESEEIPGWLRYSWMKQFCQMKFKKDDEKNIDVIFVNDENPQQPSNIQLNPQTISGWNGDKEKLFNILLHGIIEDTTEENKIVEEFKDAVFYDIWKKTLKRNLPSDIEVVFTCEDYGDKVAEIFNIRHERLERKCGYFDPLYFLKDEDKLEKFVISGTLIRQNPMKFSHCILQFVSAYYVKRIAIIGAESTGKTTMTKMLAKFFNEKSYAYEYGRVFVEKNNIKEVKPCVNFFPWDIGTIASHQLGIEESSAGNVKRFLFCDTELITTQIWSEYFFRTCPDWIIEKNHQQHYDLYILLSPDMPYVQDGYRESDEFRQWQHDRIKKELIGRNIPFIEINEKTYEERFDMAIKAVQDTFTIVDTEDRKTLKKQILQNQNIFESV